MVILSFAAMASHLVNGTILSPVVEVWGLANVVPQDLCRILTGGEDCKNEYSALDPLGKKLQWPSIQPFQLPMTSPIAHSAPHHTVITYLLCMMTR